MFDTFTKAIV